MVLALMLLVMRVALPAHSVPTGVLVLETGLGGLLADTPICHADAGAVPGGPEPGGKPSVPASDCALCPVCQVGGSWALLPGPVWIWGPVQTDAAQVWLAPPSTGPPQPERYAARPRGPPASVV